jgi:predicted small lipoprotein YifL
MKNKILAALLIVSLSACGPKVRLPDPTIEYPAPPAELMKPAKTPQTIPSENKTIANSK